MLNTLAGIIASSGGAAAGGDYESIATVTVGSGGSSTISFTSIPSTYQHLQIRATMLPSAATDYRVRYNGDTTAANYARHFVYGDGASAVAGAVTSSGFVSIGYGLSTSYPTVSVFDLLDYANTNKNKTSRALYGNDNNGSGLIIFSSGLWLNTSAVSSIEITPASGTFNQYSQFALYGIKG